MLRHIQLEHKFVIPEKIAIIDYKGLYLVISPNTARWIILENQEQLKFFNLLRNYNLQQAIAIFNGNPSDTRYVVTQIVARNLENQIVESCVSNETKQLHLYLTNGCNLRCPHCYMFSGNKSQDELTTDEVHEIIDKYSNLGGKSLTLSGGEITTRDDLAEIVKIAYNKDLRVRLLTNGVLWTNDMVKQIAPFIKAVQVSVDGFSEESNAKIRGKGNFSKSLHTIEAFIREGVETEVAITPSFDSVLKDDSQSFIEFCNGLIAKYPSSQFKIKIAEQLIPGRDVNLTEDEKAMYYKYITGIKSSINGWQSELQSFARSFRKNVIMDNCMYGVFSVDATGNVYFCSRVSSLKPIGNIRTMSFERIFELSRKAQELSNINNFKPCSSCELKYICGGGCRIDYFPEFAKITDVENADLNNIPPRQCSERIKHRFYDLMIESNTQLFD